jgi:hypothetical protein
MRNKPQRNSLSATGITGTTGPNHRNNRNNRTGTGRADLIKLFLIAMSCIVSDHTQNYNGSK